MLLNNKSSSILVLFCTLEAISALGNKWPKTATGSQAVIPYVIDASSGYTASNLALIQQAMDDIQAVTCVRFTKRTTQPNFLRIYSGNGCVSQIGMIGGRQDVSLSTGCMIRKKIVHELIHNIGFSHMHKRFDRDDFVIIRYANLEKSAVATQAFEKLNNQDEAFKTEYDYLSCMHYGRMFYSINGADTITTIDASFQDKIGRVITLSLGDARRINRMYKCPNMGNYA